MHEAPGCLDNPYKFTLRDFMSRRDSHIYYFYKKSKQSDDFSVFVNVDVLRCGLFGKSGHRHNITCQHNDKSCACTDLDVFNGYGEVLGSTELCRIVGKAVLCFCDANRKLSKAETLKLFNLILRIRQKVDPFSAVDLFNDRFNLFRD